MKNLLNHDGFTLIELMLAMGLFSVILIITTTGFININRTYTRGAIKKQLSESVQRLSEDASVTLKSPQPGEPTSCSQADVDLDAECPLGWSAICFSDARYLWKNGGVEGQSGLYKDRDDCSDNSPAENAEQIVDSRYVVEDLQVIPSVNDLYIVKGVIRTTDREAFTVADSNEPIDVDESYDSYAMRCRGSSAGSVVRNCAIESFTLVINSGVSG